MGHKKFFGKIDMTNLLFQTLVYPDDILLTEVNILFGMYEWTVMIIGVQIS